MRDRLRSARDRLGRLRPDPGDGGGSPSNDTSDSDTGTSGPPSSTDTTDGRRDDVLEPVPLDDDLADALASEIDREKTRKTVDRLLNLGECYEPLEGRVRAV